MRSRLCMGLCVFGVAVGVAGIGCGGDDGSTSEVGTFDGLFDGVGTGFNFPFDIAIAPSFDETENDIFVATYGTSEIMVAIDPSGGSSTTQSIYAGPTAGLMGAMAVSAPATDTLWTAFEQGGTQNRGGIVVMNAAGDELAVFDAATHPDAFANPGGLCWGGFDDEDEISTQFFLVNMGDGSVWRIAVSDVDGSDPEFSRVGTGLATGTLGNPSTPGNPLTTSNDTPQGGARGCAFSDGNLYVADAQNARVVRFDAARLDEDIDPVSLEDTPSELVTFPTDLAVNEDGDLIVISFDNAHAFVSLGLPSGGFIDNGLHDLNVNAGNYGTAVAFDTIWFTRANNSNGTLRAITAAQDIEPSTAGPFPPQ